MTNQEAAMFYKKTLANPNLTTKEIITEVYENKGKTPEEIDKIFSEYISIIKSVEEKGIHGDEIVNYLIAPRDTIVESNNENGITEININEGFPKFDPTGKTDVPNTKVSTNVPTFDDENIERIEPINTPIDPVVFGDTPVQNTVKSNEPVNFPNTESGLVIGEQKPVEPVRTDDFTFGDTNDTFRPILPTNPNNIDFPNTEVNSPDTPTDDGDSILKF